jgi:hypothetical protein
MLLGVMHMFSGYVGAGYVATLVSPLFPCYLTYRLIRSENIYNPMQIVWYLEPGRYKLEKFTAGTRALYKYAHYPWFRIISSYFSRSL